MEMICDYMKNVTLRHELNALTQKIFGFHFENWVTDGYFEGDYIPYSFMENGKIIANVSAIVTCIDPAFEQNVTFHTRDKAVMRKH